MHNRTGVLLINLGTPKQANIKAVRRYLREFLYDPRVIELPSVFRWILLKIFILPSRSRKSTAAYKSIWQENGSPLLINSLQIQQQLQQVLGDAYYVELGMRYGEPKIMHALQKLQHAGIDKLIVMPLFPQYASAVTGSALEVVLHAVSKNKIINNMKVISNFFNDQSYIKALAESIRPYLMQDYDFLLLSYHGLPKRQMINPGVSCYKTQCLQTTHLLAENLQIDANKIGVSFQSRLGKLPWIKPYTDAMLIELRNRGIKKILICCPSFIVDCLETLEEIGIRAKAKWFELGGEDFKLIPCLNANPVWISALQTIVLS